MMEDYFKNKQGEFVESYAPVSFGSKIFKAAQLKMSLYCKEFQFLYFALQPFWHFIWGSEKPVLILTDNKSLTRFFQAKTIPPSLWNYMVRITAFNIVVTHIPGKANAAADFLSRLQSNPNEILKLKLKDRIPIREIAIDVQAKLPDNTINELFAEDLPVGLLQVVDINTLITLKQSGNYDQSVHQLKNLTLNCELQMTKYKKTTEINAIQHENTMDDYPELETTIVKLEDKQNSDSMITKVINGWKQILHLQRTSTLPEKNKSTSISFDDFLRRWNTLQKILRTRWNIVVQTIVCTEKYTKRSHVQNTQCSNWRTFGNR